MSHPQPPQHVNPGVTAGMTMEDVQRIVAQQLAGMNAQHQEELRSMQAQLDAALASMANRGVVNLIPAHAAGPGLEVAETWSQAQQEIARSGLGVRIEEYIKKLEGVDGGNVLERVQRIEATLQELVDLAHTH